MSVTSMGGNWAIMAKMKARHIRLVVHDVRSAHNVGSLFRLADGFGVEKIYLTGITPFPSSDEDRRLPHITHRADQQIHKTALGAEFSLRWQHVDSAERVFKSLSNEGFEVLAMEQTGSAESIVEYRYQKPVALVVGNEIQGLPPRLLKKIDKHLQIPMLGAKESHNVAVAAAIALYHLRFIA